MSRIPLGQDIEYPQEYAPEVLFPVARLDAREILGLTGELPFHGVDIWNAWELTWLDADGRPLVATARLSIPADSTNIIESKSLKLYLNSLAMCHYGSVAELEKTIATDLSNTADSRVDVDIYPGPGGPLSVISQLPGECVDELALVAATGAVDAGLLAVGDQQVTCGELHSHLLRSLCPVTGQPDYGSVLLRYRGARIDPASFLSYVVSFRQHNDFHEACVERMFLDIKTRCAAEELTVYARYNRRGGLDINPFRSDFEDNTENLRLWRQ